MKNKEVTLKLINMEDVKEQKVKFLWKPYIALGKVTIIQGDPGEGKSTLTIDIAARVSRGELPEKGAEPGNVIYQNAEDGLADTIKPRLLNAGAECSRILVIDETTDHLSMNDERLEKAIVRTKAKLVILDPLQAYLGGATDMNRANQVSAKLENLSRLAEKYKCAVILVGHMNKAKGTKAIYRGLGSMGLQGSARSVLLVGRMPGEENVKVMMQTKSNLAKPGKPQAFEIVDGAVKWLGAVDVTEEEVLKAKKKDSNKRERAKVLISDILDEQDMVSSQDIFDLAKKEGISKRTLDTAKSDLGIESMREGNIWYWKRSTEK